MKPLSSIVAAGLSALVACITLAVAPSRRRAVAPSRRRAGARLRPRVDVVKLRCVASASTLDVDVAAEYAQTISIACSGDCASR